MPTIHQMESMHNTFPVLERKGDHLRSRWWKVECCMFERRKGCCCTQYFLLYMKKPCATSTPRKLSGKVFADLPFDVKALRNDNGLSFLASNP